MKNLIFVLSMLPILVGCSWAQQGAILSAYEAIERGNCIAAYRELSGAEKIADITPQLAAEITYLRGTCLEIENKDQEAIGQYLYLIKTYPNSEYASRAVEKVSAANSQEE